MKENMTPPLGGLGGIKAIIIDDERHSCDALNMLLDKCCPQVQVASICYSGADAIEKIRELKPDLIFLDIEMPNMNGFQMLEQILKIDFKVIFTTSYDQYAIKAFKFSALDYLLKPIEPKELVAAVHNTDIRLSRELPICRIIKTLEIVKPL